MTEIKNKKKYLDFSFFDKKGYKNFGAKMKLNSEKSSKAFRYFLKNLSNEAKETKKASLLIYMLRSTFIFLRNKTYGCLPLCY